MCGEKKELLTRTARLNNGQEVKVGDKVQIKSYSGLVEAGASCGKKHYADEEAIITYIDSDGDLHLNVDNGNYYWSTEQIKRKLEV